MFLDPANDLGSGKIVFVSLIEDAALPNGLEERKSGISFRENNKTKL